MKVGREVEVAGEGGVVANLIRVSGWWSVRGDGMGWDEVGTGS